MCHVFIVLGWIARGRPGTLCRFLLNGSDESILSV